MDDESGWHLILVDGWGPLVRTAVVERVVAGFTTRLGVLASTALEPDDAEAEWVQSVHEAIVAAIEQETGADIEELGSQAAWAVYDEVWTALAGRVAADESLVPVPEHRVGQVMAVLAEMPVEAAVQAGAVPWDGGPALPVLIDARARVHVDGVFRWLATDEHAAESHRALGRVLVDLVRDDLFGGT